MDGWSAILPVKSVKVETEDGKVLNHIFNPDQILNICNVAITKEFLLVVK